MSKYTLRFAVKTQRNVKFKLKFGVYKFEFKFIVHCTIAMLCFNNNSNIKFLILSIVTATRREKVIL